EDFYRWSKLDEFAEVKEGGEIGNAASLLHVVCDDRDRVLRFSVPGSVPQFLPWQSDPVPSRVRPSTPPRVPRPGRARCINAAAGRRTIRMRCCSAGP